MSKQKKTSPEADKNKQPASSWANKVDWRAASIAAAIVFAALALVALIGQNANVLRRIEEQSIFLPLSAYWSDCMSVPAGALTWLGTYLTQYFYHPWLGASILTLLGLALAAISAWAFCVPKRIVPALALPSAMVVLFTLRLGYLIFTLKTPGHAFSIMLGMMCAVAIAGAWRCCRPWWGRLLIAIAAVIVGYPLLGFYALFGAALGCVAELCHHRRLWWVVAAVAAIAIATWPQIWFYATDTIVMRTRIYLSGLPRLYPGEGSMWWPLAIAMAFMAIMAALSAFWSKITLKGAPSLVIPMAIGIASSACMPLCSYHDENFHAIVDMDRAINIGDYQKVTEIAAKMNDAPTRLTMHLNLIALLEMGQAGDRLFTFPMGDAPFVTTREATALRDAGAKMMYLQYGRPNDAYRWAMEDKVEYGLKVEYLKYMVKSCLLIGKYDAARKHLHTLSLTKYHKDWAKKYMAYADNPALIDSDPELSRIKTLMSFNNSLGGDGGTVEAHLLETTGAMLGGPPEIVELSMIFNLIRHDLEQFWPKFVLYASTHDHVPAHFQEAALALARMQGFDITQIFTPSPEVARRFDQFMEFAIKYQQGSEEQNAIIFRPDFGDTYWYNLYFQQHLQTR